MLRKAFLVGLLVAGVAISLVFAVHGRSDRTLTVEPQGSSDRVEAELLVLRSDGFEPNEITRRPGRFLLALQNHSSEEELSLVLQREAGASVRELRPPKRRSKFRQLLHLPPGRYVLREINHPEWSCTITITPH